jgi:hypothetical protein
LETGEITTDSEHTRHDQQSDINMVMDEYGEDETINHDIRNGELFYIMKHSHRQIGLNFRFLYIKHQLHSLETFIKNY